MLLVDEASFTKADLFKKTIAPMVSVTETTLICISTASDSPSSHYQSLVNKRNAQQEHFLRTLVFTAMCPRCTRAGKTKCDHQASTSWTPPAKRELSRALLGDDEGTYARELLGDYRESSNACFSSSKILAAFAAPTRKLLGDTVDPCIYVAMDPCTGKHNRKNVSQSKFALMSAIDLDANGLGIIGAENVECQQEEQFIPHVLRHLEAIRSHECYRHATIVLMVEDSLGMMASGIVGHVLRAGFTNILSYNPNELRVGTPIDGPIKREIALTMKNVLNHNRLEFCEPFVSTHEGETVVKPEFKRQLMSYSEVWTPKTDPLEAPSVKFGGKHAGNDDLCIVAQMLAYHRIGFQQSTNPAYETAKTKKQRVVPLS